MEGNISANDVECYQFPLKKVQKLLWRKQLHLEWKANQRACGNATYAPTVIIAVSVIGTTLVPAQRVKFWGTMNFPGSGIALQPYIVPLIFRYPLETVKNILYFSQFRFNESIGISSITSQDYASPVFVYTWLGYREQPFLVLSIGSFCWNNMGCIYPLTILADGASGWKTCLGQLCWFMLIIHML